MQCRFYSVFRGCTRFVYKTVWNVVAFAGPTCVCVCKRALREQPQSHAHTATLPTRRVQRVCVVPLFPSPLRRLIAVPFRHRHINETESKPNSYTAHTLAACVASMRIASRPKSRSFFWQIFNETQHDSFNCQHISQLIYTITRNPRL